MKPLMNTEDIWKQFGLKLRNFIHSKIRDPQVTDEITQELLLRIHRHGGTLREQERLESWLFRIAHNLVNDYYRKLARSREDASIDVEHLIDELNDDQQQDKFRQQLADCIKPMVDQLPGSYREIITEVDINGRSQKALAEQLGISHSTVKSQTQRGRAKLQKLFRQCCDIERDTHGKVIAFDPKNDQSKCNSGC